MQLKELTSHIIYLCVGETASSQILLSQSLREAPIKVIGGPRFIGEPRKNHNFGGINLLDS